jgi:hypothetical protein
MRTEIAPPMETRKPERMDSGEMMSVIGAKGEGATAGEVAAISVSVGRAGVVNDGFGVVVELSGDGEVDTLVACSCSIAAIFSSSSSFICTVSAARKLYQLTGNL